MKKWLWVALTVLVISLVSVGPALAETMSCDMTTIASLTDCVKMAPISNQGVLTTLLSQLSAAQTAVNSGNNGTAINILHAFIYTVRAQSGITIDSMHAQHMVMHAENVIAALGG